MKFKQYILPSYLALTLAACGGTQPNIGNPPAPSEPEYQNSMIFPKPNTGWVGDPMPMFEDGKMNMFYLYDGRDGQIGFHPYNLMTTEDFYNWTFKGTVIPFDNDETSRDLALGTGSIIKDQNGIYHAFYTGFNDRGFTGTSKKEIIQHATSVDKVNWTKHPEDGFYGRSSDFRDPYVIYMEEEQQYWMLITSKDLHNNAAILKYTSPDLVNWKNEGVFFSDPENNWNLECPTLIFHNGFWYLSYSRQTGENDKRILLYYYADHLAPDGSTEWKQAETPYFDGPGQYAGRIETFNDSLVVSGWVGTKSSENKFYDWAGNLVTHELVQHTDGTLTPKALSSLQQKISYKKVPQVQTTSSGTTVQTDKIQFSNNGYQFVEMKPLSAEPTRVTFDMSLGDNRDHVGFIFNTQKDENNNIVGKTKLEINLLENQVKLFTSNTTEPNLHTYLSVTSFSDKTEVSIEMLMENDIFTLYIDNEIAFSARTTNPNHTWGMFAYNTSVNVSDLSVYTIN